MESTRCQKAIFFPQSNSKYNLTSFLVLDKVGEVYSKRTSERNRGAARVSYSTVFCVSRSLRSSSAGGIQQHAAPRTKGGISWFRFKISGEAGKQTENAPRKASDKCCGERAVSRGSVFCQNDKQPLILAAPAPRSLRGDAGRRREAVGWDSAVRH